LALFLWVVKQNLAVIVGGVAVVVDDDVGSLG
jgi:hypothetical protein